MFAVAEHNANRKIRQKFYRRGQVWNYTKRQIHRGLTPEQAARELHSVFVNVSRIIELLIKDKQRHKGKGGFRPN